MNVKNRKKTKIDTIWNFLLNENFSESLTHNYIALHQSLPAFIMFNLNNVVFHTEIMDKYTRLISMSEKLHSIIETFLSEELDSLFNAMRTEDPADKNRDIFVNQGKILLEQHCVQLQAIIHSLENDYLDEHQKVNPLLFKTKEQKNVSNSLQKQLKAIYEEVWPLLVTFANVQLEWSREK
jgi:hypothetical protein